MAPSSLPPPQEPGAVERLVVDRVQAQLDAQLQGDDALDLKALGVLAANVATIGVLAVTHDSLPLWWLPTLILCVGVGFLLAVVWPVEIDNGPEWQTWYETFGGLHVGNAARQMLADLLNAYRENSKATAGKGSLFKLGFIIHLRGPRDECSRSSCSLA